MYLTMRKRDPSLACVYSIWTRDSSHVSIVANNPRHTQSQSGRVNSTPYMNQLFQPIFFFTLFAFSNCHHPPVSKLSYFPTNILCGQSFNQLAWLCPIFLSSFGRVLMWQLDGVSRLFCFYFYALVTVHDSFVVREELKLKKNIAKRFVRNRSVPRRLLIGWSLHLERAALCEWLYLFDWRTKRRDRKTEKREK